MGNLMKLLRNPKRDGVLYDELSEETLKERQHQYRLNILNAMRRKWISSKKKETRTEDAERQADLFVKKTKNGQSYRMKTVYKRTVENKAVKKAVEKCLIENGCWMGEPVLRNALLFSVGLIKEMEPSVKRRLIMDVSTPVCEYQPAPALISPETASIGLLLVPVAALGYFLVRRFNKPRQESSEIADLNEVVIEPQA